MDMKKATKLGILLCAGAIAMLALVGCKQLDVVGKESVASFGAVLNAIPDKVQVDEMNAGWSLSAPVDTVRFIWSEDYSKSPLHDVMIELDARPFIDAGLDNTKLPENIQYYEDMLMVGTKLGTDELKYNG